MKKKQWKKQDLNLQSSSLKSSANWAIQSGYRKLQHFIRFIDDNSNLSIKKVIFYMIYLEIMKYAFMQNPLI